MKKMLKQKQILSIYKSIHKSREHILTKNIIIVLSINIYMGKF